MNRYAKYRSLVALAQHGNFSRAAEALRLSQPALTRSIQTLEAHLGAPLVERGARDVTLTELGREVVARALPLLDRVDELDRALVNLASLKSGRVRFGAGPYPALMLVPETLARMADRYPGIGISFGIVGWQLGTQRLKEGKLELIVGPGEDAERDPTLQVVWLRRRKLIIAARAEHPLVRRGDVASRSDLLEYPFATSSLAPQAISDLAGLLGRRWQPALTCDELNQQLEFVRRTDALMLLPEVLLTGHAEVRRVPYPALEDEAEWARWGIIRLAQRSLSPAAQALVRLIRRVDDELNEPVRGADHPDAPRAAAKADPG